MGKWNWYCPECGFRSGKSRHIENHKKLHKREKEYYETISKIPNIDFIPKFNIKGKLIFCLIEFRILESIKHVINSILKIYNPDDIGFAIVYGNLNKKFIEKNFSQWKNIKLLKLDFNNINQRIYSKILKKPDFWENFTNWKHILIIQTDALILKKIDDIYFDYEYIGAKWADNTLKGGNGGFSLRNIQKMIEITEENRNKIFKNIPGSNEDLFFCSKKLKVIKDSLLHKRFAVEQIFYPNPIGMHGIYKIITITDEKWKKLIEYIKKSLIN